MKDKVNFIYTSFLYQKICLKGFCKPQHTSPSVLRPLIWIFFFKNLPKKAFNGGQRRENEYFTFNTLSSFYWWYFCIFN